MATLGMEYPELSKDGQQSRILVNARKSELANWNPYLCQVEDKGLENNDSTFLLVLSKCWCQKTR